MNVTRYLIRTARGYQRSIRHQRPGADNQWTQFPEEAEEWADMDRCHAACRLYRQTTGEIAVVVPWVRLSATSLTALTK